MSGEGVGPLTTHSVVSSDKRGGFQECQPGTVMESNNGNHTGYPLDTGYGRDRCLGL